jgi:hypothetical protein
MALVLVQDETAHTITALDASLRTAPSYGQRRSFASAI